MYIHIRSSRNQQFHDLELPILCGSQKCTAMVSTLCIDPSTPIQK